MNPQNLPKNILWYFLHGGGSQSFIITLLSNSPLYPFDVLLSFILILYWYELWFFKTNWQSRFYVKISSFLSVDFSKNEPPQYSIGQTEHTWKPEYARGCHWWFLMQWGEGGWRNPKEFSHMQRLQIKVISYQGGKTKRQDPAWHHSYEGCRGFQGGREGVCTGSKVTLVKGHSRSEKRNFQGVGDSQAQMPWVTRSVWLMKVKTGRM